MTSTSVVEVVLIVLLAACFIPIVRAEIKGRGVFRMHDLEDDDR